MAVLPDGAHRLLEATLFGHVPFSFLEWHARFLRAHRGAHFARERAQRSRGRPKAAPKGRWC